MSKIVFECPGCHCEAESALKYSGQVAQCPNCDQMILIPQTGINPGMEIGGFTIIKRLATGGMGEVWLARQKSMDRLVALKILPPALVNNRDFIESFMQETRILARLSHPNIVTAHDAGVDNDIHYLATSFIDGEDLDERLRRKGRLPELEILEITEKVAKALQYAWNKYRIIHRDIKPGNIMVTRDGEIRLMDMGISRCLNESDFFSNSRYVYGTPSYMSPEQAHNRALDCRSDIYSLGVTLYQTLTGSVPFEGTSVNDVARSQQNNPMEPVRRLNPEISRECAQMLQKMMSYRPDKRQQNWAEVLADVHAVREQYYPSDTQDRDTLTYGVIVLVFIFTCALILGYEFLGDSEPADPKPVGVEQPDGRHWEQAVQWLESINGEFPEEPSVIAYSIIRLKELRQLYGHHLAPYQANQLNERLIKVKNEQIDTILTNLREKALKLRQLGDFTGIIHLYRDYAGPWQQELADTLALQADYYRSHFLQEPAQRIKVFQAASDSMYYHLFNGQFNIALRVTEQAEHILPPAQYEKNVAILKDLLKLDAALQKALIDLKDRELHFLHRNRKMKGLVINVIQDGVVVKDAESADQFVQLSLDQIPLAADWLPEELTYPNTVELFKALKFSSDTQTIGRLLKTGLVPSRALHLYLGMEELKQLLRDYRWIGNELPDLLNFSNVIEELDITNQEQVLIYQQLGNFFNTYPEFRTFPIYQEFNHWLIERIDWQPLLGAQPTALLLGTNQFTFNNVLKTAPELFSQSGSIIREENKIILDSINQPASLFMNLPAEALELSALIENEAGELNLILNHPGQSLQFGLPCQTNPTSSFRFNPRTPTTQNNHLELMIPNLGKQELTLSWIDGEVMLNLNGVQWPTLPYRPEYAYFQFNVQGQPVELTNLNLKITLSSSWFNKKLSKQTAKPNQL